MPLPVPAHAVTGVRFALMQEFGGPAPLLMSRLAWAKALALSEPQLSHRPFSVVVSLEGEDNLRQ